MHDNNVWNLTMHAYITALLLLLTVSKNRNGVPTKYVDFIANSKILGAMQNYPSSEIPTQHVLLQKVKELGVHISLRTLKTYLAKFKVNQLFF